MNVQEQTVFVESILDCVKLRTLGFIRSGNTLTKEDLFHVMKLELEYLETTEK